MKKKTMDINPRCKELYYLSSEPEMKESPQAIKSRNTYWNYMMNVSMQNAISMMSQSRSKNFYANDYTPVIESETPEFAISA